MSDEAHRSQYDFIDGVARHMRDALPHASFVGFTGTPMSMRPWGEHLAAEGFAVRCPLLPGHGTSWQEMND